MMITILSSKEWDNTDIEWNIHSNCEMSMMKKDSSYCYQSIVQLHNVDIDSI